MFRAPDIHKGKWMSGVFCDIINVEAVVAGFGDFYKEKE